MPLNSVYKVSSTLHENSSTIVYRGLRIADKKDVVIKVLKPAAKSEERMAEFFNEENILNKFKYKSIVKLIDVRSTPHEYIHIFEDIQGDSLFDLLSKDSFTFVQSLEISLSLAQTMHVLHQKGVIHADINPKNIIYNTQTKALQLIDFGYSIIQSKGIFNSHRNNGTSGNLFYISPEQTGLTEHKVDHRSDLYSLGMSLYHLFLGYSPFSATDRYELIHKQIAFTPKPLHLLQKDFPLVLSQIISKLIEKQPQKRYQNDEALIYDLKKCLKNLDVNKGIKHFDIATRDHPIINIGEKLYGREEELAILHRLTQDTSRPQRLLISGHSGVGKTRLVEELFTHFKSEDIRIVQAKFEQFNDPIPYLGFKQLISQLFTILMSQTKAPVFSELSSDDIKILVFTFPELSTLLQPKKSDLSQTYKDMNIQLPSALQSFFNAIAIEGKPLMVFIDDLQWADESSLQLIEQLILQSKNPNLHFVTSFRDNEISDNTSAAQLVNTLTNTKELGFTHIKVSAFNLHQLQEMIQDLFTSSNKETKTLAEILFKKTDGNPFYLKTLIQFLFQEQEIVFAEGKWHYDIQKIKAYSSSLNILALIIAKISKLNSKQKHYLQYLCLLGNRYDLIKSIQMLESFGYKKEIINELEENGFIELTLGQYQFAHDQIQQNIHDSIETKEKRKLHQKISKYIDNHSNSQSRDHYISLAYHLNHAYLPNAYPQRLFEINIKALEEMISSHAYKGALQKSKWIQTHFGLEAKNKHRSGLIFKYAYLKIKVLYLNNLVEQAFDDLLKLSKDTCTLPQKLLCFTLLKDICVTQGKNFDILIRFGNELMQNLGLSIPKSKDSLQASVEHLKNEISHHNLTKSPLKILKLKTLKNNKKRKLYSLLVDYWEAAYYQADIDLMQWSSLSIMNMSFKYGNASESCFAYVLYGAQLTSGKEYKKASDFASVALKLNYLFDDKAMLPKVHNFVANYINPYTKSLSSNIALYQKSLHQSKLNGDLVFGTWANFLMHFSDFLSGHSLDQVRDNMSKENSFIFNSGDEKMILIFKVLQRSISTLQDMNFNPSAQEESEAIAFWQKENFQPALSWYAIIHAQDCFLHAEFEKGLAYLDSYVETNENEVIMFPKLRLHFIRALLYLNKEGVLSQAQDQILKEDLSEFDSYVKSSPINFKFGKLLLKAESIKTQESVWSMGKLYDAAINEARKLQNTFYISLASLCAGRYFKSLNFPDLSTYYFNEAIVGLNQWGAYATAKQLKEAQAQKLEPKEQSLSNSNTSHDSNASTSLVQTNWQSIIKSFNAISKTLDSTELITTLMQIILENASASKAILLFKEERGFKVKAKIDFEKQEVSTCDIDFSKASSLPMSLLTYSINTAQGLNLYHPADKGAFTFDVYIQKHKPASALVIPSIIEGSIEALLYLENTDLITPLSKENIKTLELLLTQASIVFKNISLYETVQKNKDKLTKAQEISHVGSWQFNSQTYEIIWSEETYRIFNLDPFSIDIDGDWFFSHIPSDDLEYVSNAAEDALNGETYYDVIHKIITADKQEKIVHQRAEVYLEDGVKYLSGTIQDITKEQESKNTILRLSQVVNQSPYASIITDVYGNIVYVNEQTLNMTGFTKEELIGSNMNIFQSGIHSDDFYKNLWNSIKYNKEIWRGLIINKIKDESLLDCQSTIFPILNEDNKVINFVSIQEDVTQQNIKDKLFLMQTKQAQMGEMLSMIAHQWRQPLSIISALGNAQKVNIMLEKSTIDNTMQTFDDIDEQVKHLSNTITGFRDFFKPDKEISTTKSSVIITKALALIEHALKHQAVEVKIEIQSDSSYKTFSHEVEQVILNIFKNAQDAFEERKIKLPWIKITCTDIKDNILIIIEDNGQGIDKEVLDTLFLPYISTKNQKQGTGLGLYMSKTIIEEHCKGEISAQNTSTGAKFVISLPLKDVHE